MAEQPKRPQNPWVKSLGLWVVILLVLAVVVTVVQGPSNSSATGSLGYSDFLTKVEEGGVKSVEIRGNEIGGRLTNDEEFRTYNPGDAQLIQKLREKGVKFDAKPEESRSLLGQLFISMLPFVLMVGIWIFVMRQMQNGAGKGAMGFGKSRAKLLTQKEGRVTFEDVAGIDEAREELQEIVEFLKDPSKFNRLGGKIPKGALLVGPPGTGKTLLARAIAGEANVPFFNISGSDFVEMFVGVGASRVRDLFEQGKKNCSLHRIHRRNRRRRPPSVALAWVAVNDEREQTLNQLLVEMDGFESATRASSSSPPPTVPTCSIRRCCDRAVSIGRSSSGVPTSRAARRSLRCT